MNEQADSQLLRAYAEDRSDPAFAELVRRHMDLVYSAALRMVCDSHLAEDVTQGVFVALAKNAAQLTDRPVLSGWLHRTAQNIAAQIVRTDVRRRTREQEAVAMNELLAAESDASWEHIAPHLDVALGELNESDRDALLFRYFERKSAREMAQTLGITDEAAQKRVTRAIERLREFFAKRGITVGASGLVMVISANAVQAAPAGLVVTISTATTLAVTTTATTTTATITKAIAMTTLQKTIITATVAAAVGFGIYEAKQAAQWREQARSLRAPQVASTSNSGGDSDLQEKMRQLEGQNASLTQALASANADKTRLETEREQAKRATALFKELADQANSKDQNPTNDYPSARHALVGFGKLALRYAQMSEREEADLSPEEKAANDELKLALVVDTLKLTKVANQFGLNASNRSPEAIEDPADIGACFLYGALGLNEQQFSDVYNLMQKYREPAGRPDPGGENPSPETKAAMKRLEEKAKQELLSVLSEEQAKIFNLISPNLQLIDPATGRTAFSFTLGEKDEPDEPEN